MTKDNNYIEIDLWHLLQILWKKAWAIILAIVIGGGVLFAYARIIIAPTYEASVYMYVNNSNISLGSTSFSISSSDLTAAQSLVDTYIVILETRTCLEEVIEKTGVPYSYAEMKEMIAAAACNNTEIFEVKVTSTDPAEAKLIANTIAKVLPNKISNVVDGASVRVVDYAVTPGKRSAPSYSKYTAIGMLIGAVLAAAWIVIEDLRDDIIHSEDFLKDTYSKIPILASVPDLVSDASVQGYYAKKSKHSSGYGGGSGGSKYAQAASKVDGGVKKS